MAGLAFAARAFVIHREGVRTVVGCRFPGVCGMTNGAVRAELTGVFARLGVTGGAFIGRGEAIVIEGRILPIRGNVAGLALRSIFPVMLIVLPVTRITIAGRPFINVVDMAFFTGGFRVSPF